MKLSRLEFFLMNNLIRRLVQIKIVILDFLKYKNRIKGKKVLEVGCGNGGGAILINKFFKPSKITGIDIDPRMINIAKSMKSKRCSFRTGDASSLNYKSNSFAGIFDFSIIHHLSNWKGAIEEIYRVLDNGGIAFIEDLSIESFQNPIVKRFQGYFDHPYNSMYTKKQFLDYMKKVGFKTLSYRSHNFLGLIRYFSVVAIK